MIHLSEQSLVDWLMSALIFLGSFILSPPQPAISTWLFLITWVNWSQSNEDSEHYGCPFPILSRAFRLFLWKHSCQAIPDCLLQLGCYKALAEEWHLIWALSLWGLCKKKNENQYNCKISASNSTYLLQTCPTRMISICLRKQYVDIQIF